MARAPADCVVKHARWVNVHSGEVLPDTTIAIASGRFASVGDDVEPRVGPDTVVIDAEGRFAVPGLCDAHMHVESGMVTVTEFARAVLPYGTTSMFIDPHEIANVLGLPGVRLMHDEALAAPSNVFVQVPSCVPSAPGLEHAGAVFGPDEIAEAMTWPGIIGLGEVMNFPGVAAGDPRMMGEIAAAMRAGKTVGGHYASRDLGTAFHGYVAGGAADDHEGTQAEDAIARVRQGMRAMLRLGSAWYDVAEQIRAVTERGIDPRYIILCTDDCHSGTLVNEGHMDRVVRHAISQGVAPIAAIRMATLNTAEHFGLERELGSITPGRRADFILMRDLARFEAEDVFIRGHRAASKRKLALDVPAYDYPDWSKRTMNLSRDLSASDFDLKTNASATTATVNVIGVVENQAPTQARTIDLPIANGIVAADPSNDVCHAALVERHRASGTVVNGFVQGFGYDRPCALASTVAHDSHHMIVVGTSKADMALAANRLRAVGGGVAFFADGAELALIELPIAGLMSDDRAESVAAKAEKLGAAMRACGCTLNNAFMQHSLLALVVIPELRISDVGLVDVRTFEVVDVVVST
ncbi:MAG: adenine deaminase [Pseudomonadota bacterium]